MTEILLIFVFGFTPAILALWMTRRAEAKAREQFKAVMEATATRRARCTWLALDRDSVVGIGDLRCRFNAHSAYLRCAVSPLGPCQNCSDYQLSIGTISQDGEPS